MDAFFEPSQPDKTNRFYTGWLVFLFLVGALLWCVFLNWGRIPFEFHDWSEINAPRFAFISNAMREGVAPLHMADDTALRSLTDRFMAIPDVMLSPQIILLRWLDVGAFMLVNLLLLYAAGFAGLVKLMKHFRLSPIFFTIIFLLFNFNGHIVSHLSIGHYTWSGYFLLPWFFWLLARLESTAARFRWSWVSGMALLLALIFLQGSFHQYLWLLIFLGAFALGAWRHAWQIIVAAFFSGLLLMGRFLPVTLLLGQFDTEFHGGFPRIWNILQAMLIKQLPANSLPFMNFYSKLGYWEFDTYVGIIGTIMIAITVTLWVYQQFKARKLSPWMLPAALLLLFSVENVYQPIANLPIPILNGERVTARFVIMPLLTAIVIALPVVSAKLSENIDTAWKRSAIIFLTLYLTIDLTWQTLEWRVTEAVKAFPTTPTDLTTKVVGNHPDPIYTNMLLAGTLIAAFALVFLILMSRWQARRTETSPAPERIQD